MELKYENLIGSPFDFGKRDCFELTRQFFAQNFDSIDIPNFARPVNWDSDKLDLIGLLYKKTGFQKVDNWEDQLRPGDVLVMAIGSSVPNHMAVYVGDNEIVHHKINSLSTKEILRPFWRMVTCYVLRHPDVPDLTPVYPDVGIEELLRQRYSL